MMLEHKFAGSACYANDLKLAGLIVVGAQSWQRCGRVSLNKEIVQHYLPGGCYVNVIISVAKR